MARIPVIFGFFLFLICTIGFSEDPPQDSARSLYDHGKFSEALEAIQKAGLNTADDYYNAGNCLFRLGKTGQAYAYYQKADALAPGSSDIRYNLSLAEESLNKAGSLQKNQSLWAGKLVPLARRMPEAYFDLIFALATSALALLAFRAKKGGLRFNAAILRPPFLIVLALWSFSGAVTTAIAIAHRVRLATVVADLGVARSGPAETFTELFKLTAGADVELTGESREGYRQIRFSLGNVGWIMDKDLLVL